MSSPSDADSFGAIWTELADGGPVLHLVGEVDVAVVEAFERSVGGRGGLPQVGAIDTSRATFLDAAGITLCLRCTADARAAGRLPLLLHPPRQVLRPLEIVGLQDRFRVIAAE